MISLNIMDNIWDSTGVRMVKVLTDSKLVLETQMYRGTGGASQGNGEFGFIPAFMDTTHGDVYLSRCSDGHPAKIHLLDGLPDHLIVSRHEDGRVKAVNKSVISGFILNEIFFTRDEAADFVSEKSTKSA